MFPEWKKDIGKPLGQKDLGSCLAVPRGSEPIHILGLELGVGEPTFQGTTGRVKENTAVMSGLFGGTGEISF